MGKCALALVAMMVCAGCGKKGAGIGTGGVDDGPPAPAWDWWKARACPDGAEFHEQKWPHEVGRSIECRRGGKADGPGATIRAREVSVGGYRDGAKVGAWPVFDEQGQQVEARTFADDTMVYGSVMQDGAALVARAATGCDSDDELMRIAGKHNDAAGGGGLNECLDRYPFFPGVAEVGSYAPDAGCVDNVWVVDCRRADASPGDKDLLARAGWARAKGPARERLALELLRATLERTTLDGETRAIAAPDGAVVVDGWATRSEGGQEPIEIRVHGRWSFAPDGGVAFEKLEEKKGTP